LVNWITLEAIYDKRKTQKAVDLIMVSKLK